MLLRAAFVLLAAALVPAALMALAGGRDLDLAPGLRVSWFDAGPFAAGLAVALCGSVLGALSGHPPRRAPDRRPLW